MAYAYPLFFGDYLGVSIGQLYVLFSDREVIPMWRFDPLVRAVAVEAYALGLGLRQVAAFLGGLGFSVGRESIGRWFLRAGEMLSRGGVGRRGFIAVDETVVSNSAGRAYLWAAREVRSGDVVAVQVSRGRGLGECLRLLEKVKKRYRGRPTIYTDRGLWYVWPMKVLGIRHRRERFGMRNPIEQWFSRLKRRIRQFNLYFPTHKTKTTERWIRT